MAASSCGSCFSAIDGKGLDPDALARGTLFVAKNWRRHPFIKVDELNVHRRLRHRVLPRRT